MAVDANVTEFPALEAGFVIMGVVSGKGCIMVATGPSDFSTGDSNFFFLGQRRR